MSVKALVDACQRLLTDKRFEKVVTPDVFKMWELLVLRAQNELKKGPPEQLSFAGKVMDPTVVEKIKKIKYDLSHIPKETTLLIFNIMGMELEPKDLKLFRDSVLDICKEQEMDVGVVVIQGKTPIRALSEEDLNKVGLERTKDAW